MQCPPPAPERRDVHGREAQGVVRHRSTAVKLAAWPAEKTDSTAAELVVSPDYDGTPAIFGTKMLQLITTALEEACPVGYA